MEIESRTQTIKAWLILIVLTSFLPSLFACGQDPEQGEIPDAVDPEWVVIDQSSLAHTVFMAVAQNTPEDKFQELLSMVSQERGAAVKSWPEFLEWTTVFLDMQIERDDYPGSNAKEGIIELLRRYAGTPIGLTWNKGIAVERSDFAHAKRTYEEYMDDPDAHARTRPKDPGSDPLNPQRHLGGLLGWKVGGEKAAQSAPTPIPSAAAGSSETKFDAAMLKAAKDGKTHEVMDLMVAGARVNARDEDGATPLILATISRDKDMLALLLMGGADVDARDSRGSTALHIAAANGRKDIVELFLRAGADFGLRVELLERAANKTQE
jgi:hypothetical protein